MKPERDTLHRSSPWRFRSILRNRCLAIVSMFGWVFLNAGVSSAFNFSLLGAGSAPPTLMLSQQGLWFEYLELPIKGIEVNPPPQTLASLPDYDSEIYRTHKLSGRLVPGFSLPGILGSGFTNTHFGCRWSGQIQVDLPGTYTFYLQCADGGKLWIDGTLVGNNDGIHALQEVSGQITLASGRHTLRLDYFEWSNPASVSLEWSSPNRGKQAIPVADLYRPATPVGDEEVYAYGTISRDVNLTYNYAASFTYDEFDPSAPYKVWFGGSGGVLPQIGGKVGDNIVLKEAASLDGMLDAPLIVALSNSGDPATFDQLHTCDPNVYRAGTNLYLTYSGNVWPTNTDMPPRTRIGMAVSSNGGTGFSRLFDDHFIIEPGSDYQTGAYGTGQSAVVRANDGWFYMIYTDASTPTALFRVVRSPDPAFPANTMEAVTNFAMTGASPDLVYDSVKERFILVQDKSKISRNTPDHTAPAASDIRLTYFDGSWRKLSQTNLVWTAGWAFGEGVGLLRNAEGRLLRPVYDNRSCLVLAGATSQSTNTTTLWAQWVEGDLKYAIVPDPEGFRDNEGLATGSVAVASAWASRTLSGWDAMKITDHLIGTVWSTPHSTTPFTNEWIAYSFPSTPINYIKLRPRVDGTRTHVMGFPKSFRVACSNSVSGGWVTLREFFDFPAPDAGQWAFVPLPGVTARAIKVTALELTKAGPNYHFQLADAGAGYDAGIVFQRLDQGADEYAQARRFISGWEPAHVTDGVLPSCWSTPPTAATGSEYIEVGHTSSALQGINCVRVYPRYSTNNVAMCFPKDFTISYFDGYTNRVAQVYTNCPNPVKSGDGWVYFHLPAVVAGKAIRIHATAFRPDNNGNNHFQLSEVQYGCIDCMTP